MAKKASPATPVTPDLETSGIGPSSEDKSIWGLHGDSRARCRKIVLERYSMAKEDNNGASARYRVAVRARTLHNLYSVTKSIVELSLRHALPEGKVPPAERAASMRSFPNTRTLRGRPGRELQPSLMGCRWSRRAMERERPRAL